MSGLFTLNSLPYVIHRLWRLFAGVSAAWRRCWVLIGVTGLIWLNGTICRALEEQESFRTTTNVTAASIKAKLNLLGPGIKMTTKQMLAHIGLDADKMDWDKTLSSEIILWTRLEGGTREVSLLQDLRSRDTVGAEGVLREVAVYERKQNQKLFVWTPEGGLSVPESARPDPKARYLEEQPVSAKWSSENQGYIADALSKRAAEWHDARVDEWNKDSEAFGNLNRHCAATDEVGIIGGSYTIRIPNAYEPDGTWGLVLHLSESAGRYLPLRLRNACDAHKLLYVGLQPSKDHIGFYWAHVAYILDCLAELKRQYKIDPKRTMLAVDYNTLPGLFTGSLHPELFGTVVLLTGQGVPAEQSRDYMRGNGPFPLDWMESGDWARNRQLGQRWGMTWSEPTYSTMYKGQQLQLLWKETGINVHVVKFYSADKAEREKEHREPMRSILAEFIEALLAKP